MSECVNWCNNIVFYFQMMDDMSWASNVVKEMENLCLHTASQSPGGGTGEQGARDVVKFICPDQCNSRGKCVNGECVCDEGKPRHLNLILIILVKNSLYDLIKHEM